MATGECGVCKGDSFVAAAHGGAVGAIHSLVAPGVEVNHARNGHTALVASAREGHAEVVRALLAVDGIDANLESKRHCTTLTLASRGGHAEVVRALLAVDGIDANHFTWLRGFDAALTFAACVGHDEVVRALLAVDGVACDSADVEDSTSLMLAVNLGHSECARALVAARGTNVNQRNMEHGQLTALHVACVRRGAKLVELLLHAGGCRFQLDDDGQTPLDLAAGDEGVLKVFAPGIDCWQRRRHGGHGWGTKEAVTTLLLVHQRLDEPAAGAAGTLLVHLPEEIWLAACAFLRSADFMPWPWLHAAHFCRRSGPWRAHHKGGSPQFNWCQSRQSCRFWRRATSLAVAARTTSLAWLGTFFVHDDRPRLN